MNQTNEIRKRRTSKNENEEIKKKIGARIKAVISMLNISLKDAAEQAKVPYPSLQNWVRGRYFPGADFLLWLAKEKNVNINWVLVGKGEIFIQD